MASLQPAGSMLETSCGSPHYACPEVIRVSLQPLTLRTPPFKLNSLERSPFRREAKTINVSRAPTFLDLLNESPLPPSGRIIISRRF